ncbi:hypothetical protein ACFO3O_21935 [Dokdonia ponticola]|uniref:Uncharacterized protein n=1 Tax=Dokdonia ponticola TaxID=2041041 RepID=A0ABV9I2F1_9FLAO
MIKRTEMIYSDYSGNYIKRKIAKELSSEPKLSINLIKYFKEFDKYVGDKKKFSGVISEHKVILISKSTFFWPKTIIEIEEGEKTKLKLIYKMYWLYLSVYIFLIITFLMKIFESRNFQILDVIIPVLIFGGIAFFGRWLQKNIKEFIAD